MNREKGNQVVHARKTVRQRVPRVAFELIVRAILPPRYELSLVICGDALARTMNRRYRLPALKLRQAGKKTYAPNVLSFPYSKSEGELFLNVQAARREARRFNVSLRARLVLLFTHGCLHLKGLTHGRAMDRLESFAVRKFS